MCRLMSFASLRFSFFTGVFRIDDAGKESSADFLMRNAKKIANLGKTTK